jgi:nucleotide-binding universal stress UspA family protein
MKCILAAIDFSPVSRNVIEQAESLAKAFSAELILIHVAAPDPAFVGYEAGPQAVRDVVGEELRRDHRSLQEIADGLRARQFKAKALFVQGPAVETILKEAERVGADAIVVGSHRHGTVHRALLGSVSEGVIRAAQRPVLVMPAVG